MCWLVIRFGNQLPVTIELCVLTEDLDVMAGFGNVWLAGNHGRFGNHGSNYRALCVD